jgi:hypothetical protein
VTTTLLLALTLCVNQGSDRRLLSDIVCPLQRVASFHSSKLPFWLLKRHVDDVLVEGVAFPPYVIVQKESNDGTWSFFRLGWRYDINWKGYIFPTLAFKRHRSGPLTRGY